MAIDLDTPGLADEDLTGAESLGRELRRVLRWKYAAQRDGLRWRPGGPARQHASRA